MQEFSNRLRRVSNHLSDEDHSKLHLVIRDAAKSVFGSDRDEYVTDWLHTEDMHADMKGDSQVLVMDYRADTDRTMFLVIGYLMNKPEYAGKLVAFRKIVEPALDKFVMAPDYTVATLDSMPWDAGHILHSVLSGQLRQLTPLLVQEKVLKREILSKYVDDCRMMESDYYNFGLELLQKSMLTCNRDVKEIQNTLTTYLGRARVKTSERYAMSCQLAEHIEKLIASM